jgi:hypothetical protein
MISKMDGRCWAVGPRCQLKKKRVLYWFILFNVIAAYLTFIFEPAQKFKLHNVEGAADGWVQDVRLSLHNDVVPWDRILVEA